MSKRPAILLAIPHLRGGGAARVTVQLARGLAARGFQVHLASMTETDISAELPPEVHLHCLGARRVRGSMGRLVRLVRQVRPDAILSSMTHLNLLVLLLRPLFPGNTRVLVRPDGEIAETSRSLPRPMQFLFRWLHRSADAILCQSNFMAEELKGDLGDARLLHVVPNPVAVASIRSAVEDAPQKWRGTGPRLLAMGRLEPAKGFDLLLRAFASNRDAFPDAELCILGEGGQAAALQAITAELGLVGCVQFEGHVNHPEEWFRAATLFVLASRHDAMPNALLEAAAAGMPIVTTPARGGIPTLLRAQPGVWMAADISADSLHAALREALNALQGGERFPHIWIENFDAPAAVSRYDAVIEQTIRERRR